MTNENSGFHWRDGVCFKREPDGSVSITAHGHITIPAAEWASIIANVSARGETSNSHYLAGLYHDTLLALVTP